MNGDACVSSHVRLERAPYHRKAGNDMDKKGILTVRMMGTISVEYEGEFFPIGTALTGKILQLFLILLYAGKKGVGREELLDAFYGNGEYANPSGSLRAAVFRLRRLLKEMLPEHEYICTDGGIYRWDEGNVTVSIDARNFEKAAQSALATGKKEELCHACSLYYGEFLSQMTGEKWVNVIGVKYQELYFKCLRLASRLLKADREYDRLLNLSTAASRLYPYEECQMMKLDCLIALKRYQEAMEVYKQVVVQYFEEQGLPPSETMLQRFRLMSGQIRYTSDMLKDIENTLKEREETQGPYYCWVSVKQFSKNDTATACQDWLRSTRLGRGSIKSHVRTVKVLGMGLFAFQERVHLWKGVTH